MIDIPELFDKYDSDHLKFDRVENKLHHRADICAFLLLDKLLPRNRDMIQAASHDEIFLDANLEELAKVATEDDILMLTRCGVHYDSDTDSLSMFV
jgi:hypothetical protein